MPFTPAHVAAVLPVLGPRRPGWAVPAALVVGSMVPDLLYFVPIGDHRAFSHSLLGVVTLDLALGLVCVGLWWLVAAPVLHDLAPRAVRTRLAPPVRPDPRTVALAVPGLLVGALTHVGWDGFTHGDGWAVRRWPVLWSDVAGLPAWKLGQYASGVLGVAVVLAWGVWTLRRARPDHPVRPVATPAARLAAWALLVGLPLLVGPAFALAALDAGVGAERVLYVLVVRALSAFGLAAVLVAAGWHLARAARLRTA